MDGMNSNGYEEEQQQQQQQQQDGVVVEESTIEERIEEMRRQHRLALSEAEAKQTELRLVLASRYRELVGSSDEVLVLQQKAQYLSENLQPIPTLMAQLYQTSLNHHHTTTTTEEDECKTNNTTTTTTTTTTMNVFGLTKKLFHVLQEANVLDAAVTLKQLFTQLAQVLPQDSYPLVHLLADDDTTKYESTNDHDDKKSSSTAAVTMKFLYLHVETIPARILRLAKHVLQKSNHVQQVQNALEAMKLLCKSTTNAELLEHYTETKVKRLTSLLSDLTTSEEENEVVLNQIVQLVQYEIIYIPYIVFCHSNQLPVDQVNVVVSNALATTLPLIRTRADEVLAAIAGTTASRLGHVRQSLFDTTEGQERREEILASTPYKISIDTAIEALVDTKPYHGNFSLWSVLFSNTFSSLVHSLLTTSFQILHSDVVEMCTSTLRYAPSFPLSHEAYTHTYHISQKLEQSFTTVSEEAHALLIHHQELQDSTRKLHQSLLIQTCQVMGRLLQQLRLLSGVAGNKDYILGRLCYLLQHQLPSVEQLLSTPVDAKHKITIQQVQSAFEMANDDNSGLLTMQDAMEAMEAAFSGSPHQVLRGEQDTNNVTFEELVLLNARGILLKDPHTTLIRTSLSKIMMSCLTHWFTTLLKPPTSTLQQCIQESIQTSQQVINAEWTRLHSENNDDLQDEISQFLEEENSVKLPSASSHLLQYILQLVSIYNHSICPADDAKLTELLRQLLVQTSLKNLVQELQLYSSSLTGVTAPLALLQFYTDVSFVQYCYFVRNTHSMNDCSREKHDLQELSKVLAEQIKQEDEFMSLDLDDSNNLEELNMSLLEPCDLLLSCLFGDSTATSTKVKVMNASISSLDSGNANEVNLSCYGPMVSSRRFPLLPIQNERSVQDLVKLEKQKGNKANNTATTSTATSSSLGFGFFSSMLKKN